MVYLPTCIPHLFTPSTASLRHQATQPKSITKPTPTPTEDPPSIVFYPQTICAKIILVNLINKFLCLIHVKFAYSHSLSTHKIFRGDGLASLTTQGPIKARAGMDPISTWSMAQLNQNLLNKEQEHKIIFRMQINNQSFRNQNIQIFCKIKNILTIPLGMN